MDTEPKTLHTAKLIEHLAPVKSSAPNKFQLVTDRRGKMQGNRHKIPTVTEIYRDAKFVRDINFPLSQT